MSWPEEWDGPLDDLLDTFGESVTWHKAGVNTPVTAILQRGRRGEVVEEDGVEADAAEGGITVRSDDIPGGPAEGDTATVPVRPGSSTTETVVIGSMVRDHGNGAATFETWAGDGRRYGGPRELR